MIEHRIRIGQRLKEIRKERGMTATELAELCGLSQTTISKVENGRWSASVDILSKICEVLDARLDIVKG